MTPRSPPPPRQWAWHATCRFATTAALLLLLTNCSGVQRFYDSQLPFDTPIDWWHQLQGGVIAEERPPPPGIGDPYPNLAQIPAKPTPPDAATRRALTARLATERDQTQRAAARDPIAALPPPPPAPNTPAPNPPNPNTPDQSNPPMARIDAAQAKPPVADPPPPPATPAPAALQAAAAPTPPPRQPAGQSFAAGPVPSVPVTPPPRPALAGIPVTPEGPVPSKQPLQVDAAFVEGSAILRPESAAALRQLATQRFGGTVAVLGGGDATSAGPETQAAALPLAWRRALAMTDVLKASGVPPSAMHVDAAALARGGIARLID